MDLQDVCVEHAALILRTRKWSKSLKDRLKDRLGGLLSDPLASNFALHITSEHSHLQASFELVKFQYNSKTCLFPTLACCVLGSSFDCGRMAA